MNQAEVDRKFAELQKQFPAPRIGWLGRATLAGLSAVTAATTGGVALETVNQVSVGHVPANVLAGELGVTGTLAAVAVGLAYFAVTGRLGRDPEPMDLSGIPDIERLD